LKVFFWEMPLTIHGDYTPVLAERSQNFRLADGPAADYSPQFGQHPVTARHANLT
jgi:hypothetical protein